MIMRPLIAGNALSPHYYRATGLAILSELEQYFDFDRFALVQAPLAGSWRGSFFSLKREQELRAPRPAQTRPVSNRSSRLVRRSLRTPIKEKLRKGTMSEQQHTTVATGTPA